MALIDELKEKRAAYVDQLANRRRELTEWSGKVVESEQMLADLDLAISALSPKREDEVLLADQQDTPPQSNAQASETDAAALDDMTQEQYHAVIEQETGHSVSCSTFDPEIGVCDCGPNTAQVSFAEDDDSRDGFELEAEDDHWEPGEQIWTPGGGSYTTERPPTPKASEPPSELETQAEVGDDRVALHDQPALSDEAFNALPKLDGLLDPAPEAASPEVASGRGLSPELSAKILDAQAALPLDYRPWHGGEWTRDPKQMVKVIFYDEPLPYVAVAAEELEPLWAWARCPADAQLIAGWREAIEGKDYETPTDPERTKVASEPPATTEQTDKDESLAKLLAKGTLREIEAKEKAPPRFMGLFGRKMEEV